MLKEIKSRLFIFTAIGIVLISLIVAVLYYVFLTNSIKLHIDILNQSDKSFEIEKLVINDSPIFIKWPGYAAEKKIFATDIIVKSSKNIFFEDEFSERLQFELVLQDTTTKNNFVWSCQHFIALNSQEEVYQLYLYIRLKKDLSATCRLSKLVKDGYREIMEENINVR